MQTAKTLIRLGRCPADPTLRRKQRYFVGFIVAAQLLFQSLAFSYAQNLWDRPIYIFENFVIYMHKLHVN